MRYDYKVFPRNKPHPAFPSEQSIWVPTLPVRLSVGHGAQTRRIDALIDSGADDCLFHADIGEAMGLKIEKGVRGETKGIAPGASVEIFYHAVKLWVGAGVLNITAGFGRTLSVAAILGRRGFFENYKITFDPSSNPPGFDIERIGRA